MEQASFQISQPLPPLVIQGCTTHPSIGTNRLSIHHMHLWPNFLQDVRNAISGLAMDRKISITNNAEGELYYVGNELGLTGRFVQNVGVAVTKAFKHGSSNASTLSHLRFADYHSTGLTGTLFPDVTIVKDIFNEYNDIIGCELRVAGEIKTFWTLPLQDIPVTADPTIKIQLELPVGWGT